MNAPSRTLLRTLALAAIASLACPTSAVAQAQDYPNQTVRIFVPVAPGGPLDMTGRLLAEHLGQAWSQSAIVENRPGGATLVATKAAAQARPDGHTLLLTTSSLSSYSALMKNPGFELAKDLSFISLITRLPQFMAVSADAKLDKVEDIVALAKAKPGSLNYGSYGNAIRVMSELTNRALGIKAESISYPGAAPAVQALVRGDLTYMLESMSTLKPLIAGNKLKVLAVAERNRVSTFPEVPTLAELGYKTTDFGVWYALVGPPGLSTPVTEKINREAVAFTRSARARGVLEPLGFALAASTPQELRQLALRDEETFVAMARALNIQPE